MRDRTAGGSRKERRAALIDNFPRDVARFDQWTLNWASDLPLVSEQYIFIIATQKGGKNSLCSI